MDLTSDHPYWRVKSGIIANYPPLDCDRGCDVAILGAGITGSLIGATLSADGHEVILLDGREHSYFTVDVERLRRDLGLAP